MKNGIVILLAMIVVLSCKEKGKKEDRSLVRDEKSASQNGGWISLMQADLWRGYHMDSLPDNWVFKEDILECFGTGGDIGGDIITREAYDNFELRLEWKISSNGNSGIFYHVLEDSIYKAPYETGAEYQLLDDNGFAESAEAWQQTGANYAMHAADVSRKRLKPIGEWNASRIVFDHGQVEHWLNGERIVAFNKFSEDWKERRNSGKWNDFPDYGKANEGYLGLQDHGAGVWFRNIQVKRL